MKFEGEVEVRSLFEKLGVQYAARTLFTEDCRVFELPKIHDPRGNLTFIEGGTPAVMNRSEPPFSTIRRSSFSNSIVALANPHALFGTQRRMRACSTRAGRTV